MQPQVKKKELGFETPSAKSVCLLMYHCSPPHNPQLNAMSQGFKKGFNDYSNMAFKLTVAIFRCIRFLFPSCDQ